ncbi:hypothetical protein EDC04DRAFT_2767592 [Pisolithus marmoratus]|nr:hypothetical protein EDC04DRAFT_2767592 [Pisolithus marmoratus]
MWIFGFRREDDPGYDDFELWSPKLDSTTMYRRLYHRRKRDANCVVGEIPKIEEKRSPLAVSLQPLSSELNRVKNDEGKCVLIAAMILSDRTAHGNDAYWYEQTAYRKVRYFSCEGGYRPGRRLSHRCLDLRGHSTLFWLTILLLIAVTVVAVWTRERNDPISKFHFRTFSAP